MPKPLPATLEHVSRLEDSIDRFVASVGVEFNKLYDLQAHGAAEFRAFCEEMRLDREESRRERREMNRKWGDLANRLGTLVEDLVFPSLPRVLRETLGQDFDSIYARVWHRLPDGRSKEFDAYALSAGLAVVNSTKATLRSSEVDRMPDEIAAFREFVPAQAHLPVVGVLSTLALDPSVLNYAERMGFLVLSVGEQLMEVKNRPGFVPKRW